MSARTIQIFIIMILHWVGFCQLRSGGETKKAETKRFCFSVLPNFVKLCVGFTGAFDAVLTLLRY